VAWRIPRKNPRAMIERRLMRLIVAATDETFSG
jgi:hypothetical protein